MDLVLLIVFQIYLANKYVIWPEESALALFVLTHATLCHSCLSIDCKQNLNDTQAQIIFPRRMEINVVMTQTSFLCHLVN